MSKPQFCPPVLEMPSQLIAMKWVSVMGQQRLGSGTPKSESGIQKKNEQVVSTLPGRLT